MSFKDIKIKDRYITEKNDIPNEFYNIVLPEAVLYKRAAGFFSSSALISISKGLQDFYYNNGKIRLIVSPIFSQEDYDAIESGYKAREEKIQESILQHFDIDKIKEDDGCNFLAWLIYEKRLEIKVVTRKDNSYGIFHDKFLILYDSDNNKISSRGSSNESRTAYEDNYETIEVDFSWLSFGTSDRTQQREEQFDEIWNGIDSKWVTNDFPEAIKKKIIEIRQPIPSKSQYLKNKKNTFEPLDSLSFENKTISIPKYIELRPYQEIAIKEWVQHEFNGIYEMATGTGKTITAISSIVKLLEQFNKANKPCGLVFVIPYNVLLEQWVDILSEFNIQPICCYNSKNNWLNRTKNAIDLFNNGYSKHFCLITTNKTFTDYDFQNCLSNIKKDFIFCVDEMHHLATTKAIQCLPLNARFRLGLSATLMTKYANEEMELLKKYFGDVIYEFPMEKAIGKFLTPYYYYPIFVELTPDELDEYHDISQKISKACAINQGNLFNDPSVTALLSRRARLIASAENKIYKLLEFKEMLNNTNYNLFYCGDKVEATSNERFITRVNNVLKNELGMSVQQFTSSEKKKERAEILKLFSNGLIQGLTAIRCLDEGVDIPALKRAFILSSGTNPKEFIQRRGRVLRKFEGKKYAEIYDFIVLPILDESKLGYLTLDEIKMEKKIIAREYDRLQEFASLAINGTEAFNEFLKKWEIYSNGEL